MGWGGVGSSCGVGGVGGSCGVGRCEKERNALRFGNVNR